MSPTPPSPTFTPPSTSPEVELILSQMTLEQKIGQVMMIGFDGTEPDSDLRRMLEQYHVGGIILFARNVESPGQVAQLTNALQQSALESGHPGLLIAIDQEGGRVARLTASKGFTEYPSAMALAATGDPENARWVGQAVAAELKALGINVNFAPVLDVNNNPSNPVIGTRSFGSDPQQVAEYGVAYLQGLQSQGVLAFGKHFPGHGDTGTDSHVALPIVPHDRQRLEQVEFVPFRRAMQAGVAGIMSAHVTFPAIDPTPGLAGTLSSKVLTGLLREAMGYDGLLVTDSLEMGALGESGYPVPLAAATALQAGADLLLFNRDHDQHQAAFERILEWVKAGTIPAERLDQAVRRVLAAKIRFGLLAPLPVDPEQAALQLGAAENRQYAFELAAQSITLLRDTSGLLPLTPGVQPFIVEVPAAVGLARLMQLEPITISQQPSAAERITVVGVAQMHPERPLILTVAGLTSAPEQAALVQAVLDTGSPVIIAAVRDPYDLLAFPQAPTLLATYAAPWPTLQALAAVLQGQAVPAGRLPVELPGLFPSGAGLQDFVSP